MPTTVPMETTEIAVRLAAATLAGGIIGLNRDLRGKPAGVRTHALVTLGSAALVMLAAECGLGDEHHGVDAISRVVQGIITGIGFLGAGVIMRNASGHVAGLTTAATVWVCAALGTVCGMGRWGILVISMVLVLAILLLGGPVEWVGERLFGRRGPFPPVSS